MPTTTMVHLRLDAKIKAEATIALAAMGLTVSDATPTVRCIEAQGANELAYADCKEY